ncbi:MAG: ROK family glucokinase [Lachnospiraceae bacterium]|nr:ROK family glucokinase [Lachnospiraceae bacterium]
MSKVLFGVDLGGTTVKMGLFDPEGNRLQEWEIPTRKEEDGVHILPDIAASIRQTCTARGIADEEVLGIGIGVPGAVINERLVPQAVNLGWKDKDAAEELGKLTGLPVAIGNDANVAALGEAWQGGGKGFRDLLLVTLGTGVGGGVITGGRLLTGAKGAGGEIGHIHLEDDEPEACGCGNHGCFEEYASATGAVRVAKRVLAETEEESTLRGKDFTCKDLFDAAAAGDAVAEKATRKYGEYLGKGLAVCASVLNPEAIVLGGGVTKAGDVLIDLLRPSFERCVFPGCADVEFKLATLGNQAGIVGAAKLVLDHVKRV